MYMYMYMYNYTYVYAYTCRYIDAVKPGKYGIRRPFYFLFLPSYWCGINCGKKVT